MKKPICPFCGWDVDHPDYNDAVVLCVHCREYVVAEEASDLLGDADLAAEIDADLERDSAQDEYESDPYNYGYDDDIHNHAFPLDGEII